MSKSKSRNLRPTTQIGLFSPHFPLPIYNIDDNIEEIEILSDVNEIDIIKKHQLNQDYDYQDDIKTWIK